LKYQVTIAIIWKQYYSQEQQQDNENKTITEVNFTSYSTFLHFCPMIPTALWDNSGMYTVFMGSTLGELVEWGIYCNCFSK